MLSPSTPRALLSTFALVALAFAAGCAGASSSDAARSDDAVAVDGDVLSEDMRLLRLVLAGGLDVQSYGVAASCGEVVTLEKLDRSLLPIGQYRIDQVVAGADGACVTRGARIAEGTFTILEGKLTLEDAAGAPLRTFVIDAQADAVKLVADGGTLERRAALAE